LLIVPKIPINLDRDFFYWILIAVSMPWINRVPLLHIVPNTTSWIAVLDLGPNIQQQSETNYFSFSLQK